MVDRPRRQFASCLPRGRFARAGATVALCRAIGWLAAISLVSCSTSIAIAGAAEPAGRRPNILWITSEDHGPQLGCYGDAYASTPNVDGLAARGIRFTHVWSCAPVCAPARTTLISGLYPTSTGSEHMRSMVPFPSGKQMFPQLLRAAGYYCTNNAKEDYNLTQPGKVWDESARTAHWKNRAGDQPFFAVFNSERSHESRIRSRPHTPVHDPAGVRVPAYHPDTPEVRRDWAQYYDALSAADADAGVRLRELEEAGLADKTIVFYFADHGAGMPRSKRWPCDSGLHVPLVIYIPEAFRELRPVDYSPGGKSDRLVSFIDFAPTVLSLAGVRPPEWLQGRAFLGPYAAPPPEYLHGFRGRMDERYDLVRSVTDGRFVYLRNYMPHEIYGQHVSYMFETPTTQVWKKLHDGGQLTAAQEIFWNVKPAEELYDLSSDPDEVRNLAGTPEHSATLKQLRAAQQAHANRILDVGFLPEGEIHRRSKGTTPYDMARDGMSYPFDRVFAAAELAASRDPAPLPKLLAAVADTDSAVRYWATLGLLVRGQASVAAGHAELVAALEDSSPDVRIVAAEALTGYGGAADRAPALRLLLDLADWSRNDVFVSMAALNALDAVEDRALLPTELLRGLPEKGEAPHGRYREYVPRLLHAVR